MLLPTCGTCSRRRSCRCACGTSAVVSSTVAQIFLRSVALICPLLPPAEIAHPPNAISTRTFSGIHAALPNRTCLSADFASITAGQSPVGAGVRTSACSEFPGQHGLAHHHNVVCTKSLTGLSAPNSRPARQPPNADRALARVPCSVGPMVPHDGAVEHDARNFRTRGSHRPAFPLCRLG